MNTGPMPPPPPEQPRNQPTRTQGFMRTSGPNPTVIIACVGAFLLLVCVVLFWSISLHRNAQSNDGTTAGTTTITAAAPGVNRTTGDTPFVIPSPAVTATPLPSPSPHASQFPFGTLTPPPLATPFPQATIAPTPQPQRTIVYNAPPPPQVPIAPTAPPRRPSSQLTFNANTGSDEGDVPALDPNAPGVRTATDTQNAAPPRSSAFVNTTNAANAANGVNATTPEVAHQTQFVAQQESRGVGYVPPASPFQLAPGTSITLRLRSKIVSDLPGPFIAQTTEPIYDSPTHSRVVVPAGTMVYANYDNGVVGGQNRLLAAGALFILPDGREFNIGGQPFADAQGAAGITGDTDEHRGRTYTAAFILTGLGAAEAAIAPQTGGSITVAPSVGSQARTAAGEQITSVGNQLVTRNLQRAPTIVARPPAVFQMIVTRNLPLEPYGGTP